MGSHNTHHGEKRQHKRHQTTDHSRKRLKWGFKQRPEIGHIKFLHSPLNVKQSVKIILNFPCSFYFLCAINVSETLLTMEWLKSGSFVDVKYYFTSKAVEWHLTGEHRSVYGVSVPDRWMEHNPSRHCSYFIYHQDWH